MEGKELYDYWMTNSPSPDIEWPKPKVVVPGGGFKRKKKDPPPPIARYTQSAKERKKGYIPVGKRGPTSPVNYGKADDAGKGKVPDVDGTKEGRGWVIQAMKARIWDRTFKPA
jgi:hypothetical protein